MSSEPEPASTAPAAPSASTEPDVEQAETEHAVGEDTARPASNGRGAAVVVELGTLDTSSAAEDEPDVEPAAEPDQDVAELSDTVEVWKGAPFAPDLPDPPDPRWNGGGPAASAEAPVGAGGGATNSGASAAASAASVAVASAVSVTADKLSSAGAVARNFGQVVAASLATPPAGVPLLRRERRTPPAAPPTSPPVAINPTATATVPETRPATPSVDEPVEKPTEEPASTVDVPPGGPPEATPDAPPEALPGAPADPPPSVATVTDLATPTLEPVAPEIPPPTDAAATTATLPRVPTIGPAPITPVRRRPRRARLKVTRLDPWTVMKIAFLLSLAGGIMTMVAVAVLWSVLDSANVFSEVGSTLREVTGGDQGDAFDLESYLSLRRVLTFTGIVAGIEVIVLTALTTLGAFLYNVSARMAGGVEVTLAEDD